MSAPESGIIAGLEIDAPVSRVWPAWSTSDGLSAWFADRVVGDLSRGGKASFAWDSLGVEIELEIAERKDHELLVFRGGPGDRKPQSQVVRFVDLGDKTAIEIRHSGFDDSPQGRDERDGTQSGWYTALRVLRHYLEHYDGKTRTSFAAMGPAVASFERVFQSLTEGLDNWLTDGIGTIGDEGDDYRLTLRNGAVISGEVLSRRAPRDIALTCRELAGVVSMRTLSMDATNDGAKMLALHVSSWGSAAKDELRLELTEAVNRLAASLGGISASA